MTGFRLADSVTPDALMHAAVESTGLHDFGPPEFREGLQALCAGLAQDRIRYGGRAQIAGEAVRHLSNRLRVVDWHRRHPGAARTAIDAPLVILGLPRTGTTAVSYLLDQDPQWRCLLNWEATDSVPPPTADTLRSDPRCQELRAFQQAILPSIDPAPPHWEWADGPTECTFLLAQDFKTVMWESRVPSPQYREFISTCDMTSAYEYHRSVLQVLGSSTTGTWCLKMPAHALFIDALLATYPDARIIWTHRDPADVTASFLNLVAFSHRLTLGEPDIGWIVDTYPERLVEQVELPMRRLPDHDIFHLHYARYLRDPLRQMVELYDWLGTPLEPEVAQAMQNMLDTDPLSASRRSRWSLDDFGLRREDIISRFGAYIDAHDVELSPT